MKEKTLSEKEVLIHVEFGKSDTLFNGTKCAGMMIHSDYVKEAVQKLKGKSGDILKIAEWVALEEIIDKIFGEDLK